MSNNSYQKNGGVGVYNEIPNGGGSNVGGSSKKWLAALAVVAVAVGGYFYIDSNKHSGASVAKVMEKADLNVKADGKLKLFDKDSKLISIFALLRRIMSISPWDWLQKSIFAIRFLWCLNLNVFSYTRISHSFVAEMLTSFCFVNFQLNQILNR